ncbi:hypothetical protein M501DRAFT_997800 [Patellaria atrata CBS 101060]|uniref:Uncharacterized protein n=1 Tax=Patellaria atrata CBS 101060 TaxID=1346257 RepID=A0A9P4VJU6_9PEZI|nr:hypothetical protein M501DRAFT_997800 [Patellaria atrata CBS 101060]
MMFKVKESFLTENLLWKSEVTLSLWGAGAACLEGQSSATGRIRVLTDKQRNDKVFTSHNDGCETTKKIFKSLHGS